MEKGLFIVLEGVDNSGKTTQSNLLRSALETRGLQVVQTREPGGTPVSEEIRQVLLKSREKMMDPVAQTLLFYAARAEFLREVVKPNLEKGVTVVTDRFEPSTYVYQGYVQGISMEVLGPLHNMVVDASGCTPDTTFIFDITAEESYKREQNADNTAQSLIYEQQGFEFRQRLVEGYRKYAISPMGYIGGTYAHFMDEAARGGNREGQYDSTRTVQIDAMRDIYVIHKEVMDVVSIVAINRHNERISTERFSRELKEKK